MDRIFALGLLVMILNFSCSRESDWKTISNYPNGETKIQQEYYLNGDDTVFIYQKIFGIDGSLQLEGTIENDKRQGLWKSYYPNGDPWSQTEFKDGLKEGQTKTWYRNGKLRYSGYFIDDKEGGEWHWYDSTGTFIKKAEF